MSNDTDPSPDSEGLIPLETIRATKPASLREAKRLMSQRIRDPKTDPKSFTRLMAMLGKLSGWKRKPRRTAQSNAEAVNDLVRRMEKKERTKPM